MLRSAHEIKNLMIIIVVVTLSGNCAEEMIGGGQLTD